MTNFLRPDRNIIEILKRFILPGWQDCTTTNQLQALKVRGLVIWDAGSDEYVLSNAGLRLLWGEV